MKIGKDNLLDILGQLAGTKWLNGNANSGQASGGPPENLVQRRNRAGSADLDPISSTFGRGGGWANPEYGAYYASSVSVYAAIKLRADAVSRPAVRLYRTTPDNPGRRQAGGRAPASGAATAGTG